MKEGVCAPRRDLIHLYRTVNTGAYSTLSVSCLRSKPPLTGCFVHKGGACQCCSGFSSFRFIFLVSGRGTQCFHRVAIGSHSVCDLSHATREIPRGLIDLGCLIKKLIAEILLASEVAEKKSRACISDLA